MAVMLAIILLLLIAIPAARARRTDERVDKNLD